MSLGQGASLNAVVPFPASNAWNQDISSAPVDSNSANIINFIGGSVSVHPDFGSGEYAKGRASAFRISSSDRSKPR